MTSPALSAIAGRVAATAGAASAAAINSRRLCFNSLSSSKVWFVAQARDAQFLVHDQKCAETVKVVYVSFAREIVSQIAHVCAFANVDQVRHAVDVLRKFGEHAAI